MTTSGKSARRIAKRPRPGEIIIKLREGDPVRQIEEEGRVSLWRGRERLDQFDSLLDVPGHALRQSFPRFVAFLRVEHGHLLRPDPRTLESLDHFLSFLFPPERTRLYDLLAEIRNVDEVAYARAALPDFGPPQTPVGSNLIPHQQYLDQGTDGGVNAHYSWTVQPGGDGGGVTVVVCDSAFQDQHTDLAAIQVLAGNPGNGDVNHGTRTLGVLAGIADGIGVKGICHAAGLRFSTTENRGYTDAQGTSHTAQWSGFRNALDVGLASGLEAGDVVLLEAQQFVSFEEGFLTQVPPGCGLNLPDYDPPTIVPPEANVHVRAAMNAAAEAGFIIVEPAGNEAEGGNVDKPLSVLLDDQCGVAWNPTEKSLAVVMVGGGHAPGSATPHRRRPSSNWGERVDCQGWGENVVTTTDTVSADAQIADLGPHGKYTKRYGGTSAASAIVAGVATCLQGAHRALKGSAIDPPSLQTALRDPELGTPELPELGHDRQIGPLPDLYKLLHHFGLGGDVFARDHPTDDGEPSGTTAIRSRSPDVIALAAPVPDPQTAFVPTWNNPDLSDTVEAGASYSLYVRGRNRGPGPDRVKARLWIARPAPFLHPRDWTVIGETHSVPVGPFEHVVFPPVDLPESELSPPHQYTLISDVCSVHIGPSPLEETVLTNGYLHTSRQTNDVRLRNLLRVSVKPESTAKLAFRLRGMPEGAEPFTFHLHLPLPPGTKGRIQVNETLSIVAGNQVVPFAGLSPSNPFTWTSPVSGLTLANVLLEADGEKKIELQIEPMASAVVGKYTGWLDQTHDQHGHLGRLNFEVTVEPPA